MRRKDKEITSQDEIINIVKNARICHVAFHDEKYPYIIPLCYGFDHQEEKKFFYFHVAKAGKKLDLIKKNPHVAFEIEKDVCIFRGKNVCDYSMEYESVCGTGTMRIVEDEHEKVYGLQCVTKHNAFYDTNEKHISEVDTELYNAYFGSEHVQGIVLLELSIESWTGKRSFPQ